MLHLFKKKAKEPEHTSKSQTSFWQRLTTGLSKTREKWVFDFIKIFRSSALDQGTRELLEEKLLSSDVGVAFTEVILTELLRALQEQPKLTEAERFLLFKDILISRLRPYEATLEISEDSPHVMLFVGVNGAGKTTTIGKLAHRLKEQGYSLLIAAADTFRAAAVEQLQGWGERNNVPVIAQKNTGDPAAVVFDALQSARAKSIRVLMADTAGRLHTQSHLLQELKKIKRTIQKQNSQAPHHTLLVIDASMGQNVIAQAKAFHEAIGLSGLIITKLDGTAKAGVIFAVTHELKLPIYFIGTGEGIGDLQPFQAEEFVQALLFQEEQP